MHGIEPREGAELRKRASVFQRSTQGAKRRSGSGRRQPHADIPLGGHHLKCEARYQFGSGLFATDMPGFGPGRVRIPASSDGPWAKNGKYEYCYRFSNIDFMPSEVDLDVRCPTAEELQTFIG